MEDNKKNEVLEEDEKVIITKGADEKPSKHKLLVDTMVVSGLVCVVCFLLFLIFSTSKSGAVYGRMFLKSVIVSIIVFVVAYFASKAVDD